MSERYDYDLFVIGAGSAGVRASRLAAKYGAKTAVAEEFRVGGTCVIRGCVPKKLFVYASAFGHALEDMPGYGWSVENARFDWPTLVANKDKEIDRLNAAYIRTLNGAGVEMIQTRAVVAGPHSVRLLGEGRDVTARKILVATGGRPLVDPDTEGADLGATSNEAFHLPKFPERVLIVGGGYIAIEFAHIFKGLGAEVTLVHRGDALLRHFDHEVSREARAGLERAGVRLVFETRIRKIETAGDARIATLSDDSRIEADFVLWAIGRAPNTAGLGLDEAGVRLRTNGAVVVDGWSRSSTPSIFAVGDVTDRMQLTPVAIREGHAFAETEFNGDPQQVDYDAVPHAVFAQPPIGVVGLSEAEARARFGAVDIYKTDFRPMKNTLSGSPHRTFMKLVVDAASERVVGVHIVGEDAAEMAQCLAIAVKAGVTKKQFDSTVAVHPTAA
ncbi:MAG: glutathione-disulfide reductase, partial [Parvularculaceae bacterium]|nr:glutathione-disulfide reductase [Parvularculaceae bacterium]